MKKMIIYIGIVAYCLVASCTPTRLVSSWRNPDKQITIGSLNKILVVGIFKSPTANRIAEDNMAAYLHGKGIVSYNYLKGDIDRKNETAIYNAISKDGFDAAITMRLIDVDKDKVYVPGMMSTYPSYYSNFNAYYARSLHNAFTPGYYTTTKTYNVEINVYSIKDNSIIWIGLTQTTNPDGVQKLTNKIAKTVYKHMVKEGFIVNE